MYMNYKSAVSVGGYFGHPFSVRVGVHHGSILCPLLFIISMDQVSKDHKKGLSQELLDAHDIGLWVDNLQDLEAQYTAWKQAMNTKRLSLKKSTGVSHGAEASKCYCGVCLQRVGSNSILCSSGGC